MLKPLLIFLLLITGFRAQAQTFVSYSLAQGLPQSQVYATLQDSRGYMWFGTQGGGLCRFDGLVLQNYTTDHGLPSNYVNAIFEDADQRLWVGTNAGVCISKGNIFEPIAFAANVKLQVLSFC